jgi:hypothetical protein
MIKPSNIALAISGILIITALILLYIEINKGTELKRLKLIDLLLFLSSAISLHGLLHMGAEVFYKYNPLEGKIIY